MAPRAVPGNSRRTQNRLVSLLPAPVASRTGPARGGFNWARTEGAKHLVAVDEGDLAEVVAHQALLFLLIGRQLPRKINRRVVGAEHRWRRFVLGNGIAHGTLLVTGGKKRPFP